MNKRMNSSGPFYAAIMAILLLFLGCKPNTIVPTEYRADIALQWNDKIMELAIQKDGLLTLNGVRTEAMASIAMHNALNAIQPIYSFYEFSSSPTAANPEAAAAQAAFDIALHSFPESQATLTNLLDLCLTTIPEGPAKELGVELGKIAAASILKVRKTDSWDGEAEYTWHPMAPGVYAEFNEHSGTPEGFVFGAGWATAQPFMLNASDQFRSPPPPSINSEGYTAAFNEVKAFGKTDSETRTDDQTHLAMWWKDFVEKSHNKLARELIQKENLNLWETARALALLNMTIYDAYVNVFDNKFYYNHWRPYTAIRWAEFDENPATAPDENWNNLHQHTYAFPSYPSAHGTASSAAMRVLANALGTGDNYAFTMTTEEVDSAGPFSEKIKMTPPTRSFNSFTAAGLEASVSRVYLGIHFRYDSEEGHRLGNKIGDYANANFMAPLRPAND